MAVEATMPRIGELRIEDVRAVLGDQCLEISDINVFVLGQGAQMSSACVVQLGWISGGRGEHRALVCPSCGVLTRLLRTDGHGGRLLASSH